MMPSSSPFLDPGPQSAPGSLALLHLKRDLLVPTILSSDPPSSVEDYAEGKVTNTRFGSFPHSTILKQPWGTQILASNVDTGSRGSKKRKRGQGDKATPEVDGEEFKGTLAKAETASSGFVHLVPPTPEAWTLSLPHRTQVVYTPDYSYILQRLKARPGDHIIEAGAGSGSFTHAAVRAVFNGYPNDVQAAEESGTIGPRKKRRQHGRVFSYEFHEPRAVQLTKEIQEHGLDSIVRITNRDVYKDGFCLPSTSDSPSVSSDSEPNADLIFLDLPAPWLALKQLTRSPPSQAVLHSVSSLSDPSSPNPYSSTSNSELPSFSSPLNPRSTIRICTFNPCIEQVARTVSALRSLGWVEISMVEILHKRLEVRRERVGLQEEGLRGANASAATVGEAVKRLRDVEGRAKHFHELQVHDQKKLMRKAEEDKRKAGGAEGKNSGQKKDTNNTNNPSKKQKINSEPEALPPSKHDRLEAARLALEQREIFKEGRLLHKTEPELKTHTSYLVFAVLPRAWSREDEERARKKWGF